MNFKLKSIAQLFFCALMTLQVACFSNEGGISGTGDGTSVSGASYKGPLIEGSRIKIYKVTNAVVSDDYASSTILSHKGDFKFKFELGNAKNTIVSVSTTGQYFDENTGLFSSNEVELKALIQLNTSAGAEQTVYITSLTHLAHDLTLQLLSEGKTYQEATSLSKTRVLTLLSALTGDQNIESAFNNIGLINSQGTVASDNSFLLYLSALLTKATNIEQAENSEFTTQDLFNTLDEHIVNNTAINNDTLAVLQSAQEQLDANEILLNLSSIFLDEPIAEVQPTITAISPGLDSPTNFTTAVITNSPSTRRFCYDGAINCDADTSTGGVVNNGSYTYHLQVARQGSDYASYLDVDSFTPRNNPGIDASLFLSGVDYEARVRKVWPNGQYSAWAELGFSEP